MATVSSQQSAKRADRQNATHRLRNDRKQEREKAKCQSGKNEKTKIDHKEGSNRVFFSPQKGKGEKKAL